VRLRRGRRWDGASSRSVMSSVAFMAAPTQSTISAGPACGATRGRKTDGSVRRITAGTFRWTHDIKRDAKWSPGVRLVLQESSKSDEVSAIDTGVPAEKGSHNPWVVGSSPTRPTRPANMGPSAGSTEVRRPAQGSYRRVWRCCVVAGAVFPLLACRPLAPVTGVALARRTRRAPDHGPVGRP